jgi:hypothetical protein
MNGIENRNENGIKALIRKGRKKFRIDENLRYCEPDHFKIAEKKFIKECILNGKCGIEKSRPQPGGGAKGRQGH